MVEKFTSLNVCKLLNNTALHVCVDSFPQLLCFHQTGGMVAYF